MCLMLYKSPCRCHRCHYVSFASKEVEVRKEKTEIRPENTFVYLKVQSETEEFEESRKPNMTLNS